MAVSIFTAVTLRMFFGVIIWAVHFLVIYGFTALSCARGFHTSQWLGIGIVPWTIGVATVVAVVAIGMIVMPALGTRRAESFEDWMTATIGGLAVIAIVWESLPVLMVPTCG
jgi:hypothetical protein